MYDRDDYQRHDQNPRSKFVGLQDNSQNDFSNRKYVIYYIIQTIHLML